MMARKKQSRGKCGFCEREMTKGGLSKHLRTCPQRKEAISEANQGPGKEQTLYRLQVQDAWLGDFWLHLEMKGSATLDDLDYYLRAIWLECCGHLSRFSIGGWGGDEISKKRRVEQVFRPGLELTHIYDFGTSSETLIKVVDVRKGKPLTPHPIFLMAPLNVIGELAKVVSISFRLFGNIMGGSIIILVVSYLTYSIILPPFLNFFFVIFIGAIQAFVFTMLTLVYISVQVH